jgi:2'-5' RNA ligase
VAGAPRGGLSGAPAVLRDRLLHRLAWEAGRARLRAGAGRTAFVPPPSGPAAALHLTTVARLPAEVVATLAPALARLRADGPGHHWYPPGTVHLTVQNLDGLDLDGDAGTARLAELRALLGAHAPFPAAVRGLGVSAGTVFAQVLPCDASLRRLRADLRGFLRRHAVAPRRARPLGHANLVRFVGPVTAAFLAELARQRRRDFGSWTVTEVELVRTDRYLSQEGTTVLARLGLGPTGTGPGRGPS